MKMSLLPGPYVKLCKMGSGIDQWLEHHLFNLNIYGYLYGHIWRRTDRPNGAIMEDSVHFLVQRGIA